MRIVAIGDSLTYGYGVARVSNWVSVSEKELNIEIINKGVTGDTSLGLLARFNRDVVDSHPNGVFILCGSNDIFATQSFQIAKESIWTMVYQARAACIEPILGIPMASKILEPDWASIGEFPDRTQVFESFSRWIFDFGRAMQVPIIDFYGYFQDLERLYTPTELYLSDGIHPNVMGHKLLSEYFCKEVRRLLNKWRNYDLY